MNSGGNGARFIREIQQQARARTRRPLSLNSSASASANGPDIVTFKQAADYTRSECAKYTGSHTDHCSFCGKYPQGSKATWSQCQYCRRSYHKRCIQSNQWASPGDLVCFKCIFLAKEALRARHRHPARRTSRSRGRRPERGAERPAPLQQSLTTNLPQPTGSGQEGEGGQSCGEDRTAKDDDAVAGDGDASDSDAASAAERARTKAAEAECLHEVILALDTIPNCIVYPTHASHVFFLRLFCSLCRRKGSTWKDGAGYIGSDFCGSTGSKSIDPRRTSGRKVINLQCGS